MENGSCTWLPIELTTRILTWPMRRMIRLLGQAPHLWLDPIQVKVRGIDNPVVKAVMDSRQQYPSKFAIRLRNRLLGGRSVEEAYVYALANRGPELGPISRLFPQDAGISAMRSGERPLGEQ